MRASSQNLPELEKDKTSESADVDDDAPISFESASDVLLYVIPSDLTVVKRAVFSSPSKRVTRKETFLKSFAKKLSRMDTAPRSPRQNAELDLETGAGSCASPRSPGRHLSMIGVAGHSEDHPRFFADGVADLSEDDQTQRTFLSSGSAVYGKRTPPNRSLTSRNYEDPSTQSTIS